MQNHKLLTAVATIVSQCMTAAEALSLTCHQIYVAATDPTLCRRRAHSPYLSHAVFLSLVHQSHSSAVRSRSCLALLLTLCCHHKNQFFCCMAVTSVQSTEDKTAANHSKSSNNLLKTTKNNKIVHRGFITVGGFNVTSDCVTLLYSKQGNPQISGRCGGMW